MSGPEKFFEEQFDLLEGFMKNPDKSVLRLVIDPEMHRVPIRFLEAKDNDDGFAHLIIAHTEPFDTHVHWNDTLLKALDAQIAQHEDTLKDAGVDLESLRQDVAEKSRPWENFLHRAEILADGLRDFVTSLVFVIWPDSVRDERNFARTVKFFADNISTSALKLVVYDDRVGPLLEGLREHPNVEKQLFWLSPDEIEKRAMDQVKASAGGGGGGGGGGAGGAPKVDPAERRRALAIVGVMASGRKDFDTAEKAQTQLVKEAKKEGDPTEIALALYNLGNTYMGAERYEEAVDVLMQAADGCVYHKLDELAPMAFSNLGIAMHHAQAQEQAFECLKIARDMFRNQKNLPGEAYVCDALALLKHGEGKRDEAEKSWRYGLKLYDKISNPDLADVKRSGQADIRNKMKEFGYADG